MQLRVVCFPVNTHVYIIIKDITQIKPNKWIPWNSKFLLIKVDDMISALNYKLRLAELV